MPVFSTCGAEGYNGIPDVRAYSQPHDSSQESALMTRVFRRRSTFVGGLPGILGMLVLAALPELTFGQQPAGKKEGGGVLANIDAWHRPEGDITSKSRRYYLWYE